MSRETVPAVAVLPPPPFGLWSLARFALPGWRIRPGLEPDRLAGGLLPALHSIPCPPFRSIWKGVRVLIGRRPEDRAPPSRRPGPRNRCSRRSLSSGRSLESCTGDPAISRSRLSFMRSATRILSGVWARCSETPPNGGGETDGRMSQAGSSWQHVVWQCAHVGAGVARRIPPGVLPTSWSVAEGAS